MPFRLRVVLVAVPLVLACAGSGSQRGEEGNRVATGFPQPDVLRELERRPAPVDLPFPSRYRDVASWELEGPFPEVVGDDATRAGSKPWDRLLDRFVRSRAGLVVATPAMECFAREAGRFLVAHDAFPGLGPQYFLAGRCAVSTAPPTFASLYWESPGLRSLDQALDELGDQIEAKLRQHVVGGPLDVGVWARVEGGRLDVVIATGDRVVRIDPVSTVPGDDGRMVLAGEVLQTAVETGALASQGRLGWETCEASEEVALPRFRYECRVEPEDAQAWLSLYFVPPGSVMPRIGVQVLARPGGGDVRRYARHPYVPSRPVDDVASVPEVFAGLLNEVRRQAGAPPLRLEPEQSRTAAEVAPHYFAAMADPAQETTAELIALGMMAGWDVPDIVQEGRFSFMFLVESRDVASLLSDALDHPGARMALLDPELERIAVGPIAGAEQQVEYVALIASTYKLFSESEHRLNAERVHDRLAMARVERARLVPRPLEEVRGLTVAAASRVQGGEAPDTVLRDLIQQSMDRLGRSVMGWVGETQDLDTLVFPEEFLDRRQLDVAIAVAFHAPRGEPWGRYVVLMVAAEPESRGL